MDYDVIIGLEIHAELNTKTKMFCACPNIPNTATPNFFVCPICLGHPGTLPKPNKKAIENTILAGLALGCKINNFSKFDRKNYFYPDLPKGYQISQYDLPLAYSGFLDIDGHKILITRIHLEEDTGKSSHAHGHTLIDYNRAGAPLMELVTEPVIGDAAEAKKFCQKYQQILRYLEISNADMEKGEMRCEANISLQKKGSWEYDGRIIKALGRHKLNHKVEIKNINSFRSLEKAINFEISRQNIMLDKGEEILAETRGWDEKEGMTVAQRKKESSADYRYFPEPDIPPLNFSATEISKLQAELVELPSQKKKRFINEYRFSPEMAEVITADKKLAAWTEEVISELAAWIKATDQEEEWKSRRLARMAGNWISGEILKLLNLDNKKISDIKITPENMAELVSLVANEKINSSAAQKVIAIMYESGKDPSNIIEENNLAQSNNQEELGKLAQEIISKYSEQAEEYRQGKTNVLQFLLGKMMAGSGGRANPIIAKETLEHILNSQINPKI